MSKNNQPTTKGEANLAATRASGKDATQGDKTPVPVTQDSAAEPRDSAPTQGGNAIGVPTGKLDQDRDGVAETPEVGQEHSKSPATPAGPVGPVGHKGTTGPTGVPGSGSYYQSELYNAVHNSNTSAERQEEMASEFESICEAIGRGVKKLTDAGIGGGEAGRLALEIWKHQG